VADALTSFSAEDLALLREMVREFRQRREPSWFGPPLSEDPEAPDTYAALTPAAGIPALAGAVPGSASCAVYQVVRDAGTSPALLRAGELSEAVYNLGATAVPGNAYVPVHRDKFGTWLVQAVQEAFWAVTTSDGTAAPSMPNYVSKATATASAGNSSVTVSLPASTFEGYVLVAAVAQGANAAAVSTPAGWTLLTSRNATGCSLTVFYKIRQATGAEPATHTFTSSSGTPALSAVIYAFQFSGRPEDFVAANGSGTALTATGPATRYDSRTVLAVYSNASSTVATPGAMVTDRGGVGANSVGVTAGSITVPKAAPTGAFTATQGGAVGWAEVLVVLPHAPVGHSWVEATPAGPAGFSGGGGFIPLVGGRSGTVASASAMYEASGGRGLYRGTVLRAWNTNGYYEGVPLNAPAVIQVGAVTLTSGSPVNGLYPAHLDAATDPDANPMTWTSGLQTCWAAGLQAEPLVYPNRYLGILVGTQNDGTPVFACTPLGLSITTTNNGTGDSAYPGSTTWFTVLSVDQASGLKFSSASTLSAQDASRTHKGVVTTVQQVFGGEKQFFLGTDSSYGVTFANNTTLNASNAAVVIGLAGTTPTIIGYDPSVGVSMDVMEIRFTPNTSGITGWANPIFTLSETNLGRPVLLVLQGTDGTHGPAIVINDAANTQYVGVTETTPVGKQPIFVGGVCVGHTP
jgi:hypothetical protein